jgi:MFS family permease
VSFLGVLAVLYRWPRPPTVRVLGAEPIGQAIRAGMRYVRSAPAFGSLLARSALFMISASGLWALLPAVARGPLHLGANGYGGLLAAVGLGALIGTAVLPPLRASWGAGRLVTGATLLYAAAVAVVGLHPSLAVVVAALVLAGLSWVAVQSTMGATAQLLLPTWARARALAYYQLVFMGGRPSAPWHGARWPMPTVSRRHSSFPPAAWSWPRSWGCCWFRCAPTPTSATAHCRGRNHPPR